MSLAEQALVGRDFTTIALQFSVYCYKCNAIMRPGEPVMKYDGATFTHINCPNTPFKTFAPHKYGGNR